jgi:hypothetical protein
MIRSGLALILMVAAQPALAALSGFYDSAEKIGTILSDDLVADELRQAPVWSVTNSGTTKDGHDEWLIRTQDCDLTVALVAVPPSDGMVGMTTYTVRIVTPCG